MPQNEKQNQTQTLSQRSDIDMVLKWIRNGVAMAIFASFLGWMAVSLISVKEDIAAIKSTLNFLVDKKKSE